MRKGTIITVITMGLVLHSCSNSKFNDEFNDFENSPPVQVNHSLNEIVSIDGILHFPSIAAFHQMADSISHLSEPELIKWEKTVGFTSLYRLHSQADTQLETLKTREEYYDFKAKNSAIFIFNDKDFTDLSIYIPCSNITHSKLISMDGFVYIKDKKENFIDIQNYDEYNRKRNGQFISPFGVSNGVNYCSSEVSDRKFRASIGISFGKTAIRVNASKKILFGWKEYTTAYYWKYTPNGPIQYGQECKSGTDILIINGFSNGTKLHMWSRGVGEANLAIMTVQL